MAGLTLAALHSASSAGEGAYAFRYEIGLSDRHPVSSLYVAWQVESAFPAPAALSEREFVRFPVYSTDGEVFSVFGQRKQASTSSWQAFVTAVPIPPGAGDTHARYQTLDQDADKDQRTSDRGSADRPLTTTGVNSASLRLHHSHYGRSPLQTVRLAPNYEFRVISIPHAKLSIETVRRKNK